MEISLKNARAAFAVITIKIRCGCIDGYHIAEGKAQISYRNKGIYHDDQEEAEWLE